MVVVGVYDILKVVYIIDEFFVGCKYECVIYCLGIYGVFDDE